MPRKGLQETLFETTRGFITFDEKVEGQKFMTVFSNSIWMPKKDARKDKDVFYSMVLMNSMTDENCVHQ